MRENFIGYYCPNEKEFRELWLNCTFIFDANVLLNLYRYPQEARDDLLKILNSVSDRLWLPHQAALEYQKNRLVTIAEQIAKYDNVRDKLQKSQSQLESELGKLQLKKRHSRINPDRLLSQLKSAFDEFLMELEQLEQEQPDVFQEDPIRQEIDKLFAGKIGLAPESQKALDTLYDEGRARYKAMIPPGYEDTKKEGDEYSFGGLTYRALYGDWILWHQIITEASNNDKFKRIIFVTDDAKEDWWWVVNSKGKKTIGPRPELVTEIYAKAPVTLFYMYNSQRFMQFASDYLDIEVREKSLRQVHDIAEFYYGLHIEDDTSFNEFLQTLIDMGNIEDESLSITEKVIAAGIESLDDREMRLFKEAVLDIFTVEKCSRCGNEIPWSEMYDALENDNLCSWCLHMREKMKRE